MQRGQKDGLGNEKVLINARGITIRHTGNIVGHCTHDVVLGNGKAFGRNETKYSNSYPIKGWALATSRRTGSLL